MSQVKAEKDQYIFLNSAAKECEEEMAALYFTDVDTSDWLCCLATQSGMCCKRDQ